MLVMSHSTSPVTPPLSGGGSRLEKEMEYSQDWGAAIRKNHLRCLGIAQVDGDGIDSSGRDITCHLVA